MTVKGNSKRLGWGNTQKQKKKKSKERDDEKTDLIIVKMKPGNIY